MLGDSENVKPIEIKKPTTKKRKIKKLIRKQHDNTQNNTENNYTQQSLPISNIAVTLNSMNLDINNRQTISVNPTKRRVVVPVTRRKSPTISTVSETETENKSHIEKQTKRKVIVTKKRILPKISATEGASNNEQSLYSSNISEPEILPSEETLLIPTVSQNPIPSKSVYIKSEIYLDVIPQIVTKQRTYTYLVTRVHDGQTETMSTTSIQNQIKTINLTLTKSSILTMTAPSVPMTVISTNTMTDITKHI